MSNDIPLSPEELRAAIEQLARNTRQAQEAALKTRDSFISFLTQVGLPWIADKLRRLWNGAIDFLVRLLDSLR